LRLFVFLTAACSYKYQGNFLTFFYIDNQFKIDNNEVKMESINEMKLISSTELKDKLDRGDDFKLVMTFHEGAFRAKHIPGSINVYSEESAKGVIEPSDEIVIYCVNEGCVASITTYRRLSEHGFTNVRRFAGGLEEWEEMGFPLEGVKVDQALEPDDNFTL
jgi:rhodanese-related sulfurtransferase